MSEEYKSESTIDSEPKEEKEGEQISLIKKEEVSKLAEAQSITRKTKVTCTLKIEPAGLPPVTIKLVDGECPADEVIHSVSRAVSGKRFRNIIIGVADLPEDFEEKRKERFERQKKERAERLAKEKERKARKKDDDLLAKGNAPLDMEEEEKSPTLEEVKTTVLSGQPVKTVGGALVDSF